MKWKSKLENEQGILTYNLYEKKCLKKLRLRYSNVLTDNQVRCRAIL